MVYCVPGLHLREPVVEKAKPDFGCRSPGAALLEVKMAKKRPKVDMKSDGIWKSDIVSFCISLLIMKQIGGVPNKAIAQCRDDT